MNYDDDYNLDSEAEYDPSKWYGSDEPEVYDDEEEEVFYGYNPYYYSGDLSYLEDDDFDPNDDEPWPSDESRGGY